MYNQHIERSAARRLRGWSKVDKKQFIKALASRTGLTIQDARRALNACLDLIVTLNSHQEAVTFRGFGTFTVHHRKRAAGRWVHRATTGSVPAFLPAPDYSDSLS